jgi:serine kinase
LIYNSFQIAIKNLNKEVATKEYLSKFLPREIEILQALSHPNIVQVFQIIETEKKAFIMLELAENGDLLDYINARRYLNESEARFILRQMSCGIAYCHSIDVVHRDLKCENIMLSKDMDVKIGGMNYNFCACILKAPGVYTVHSNVIIMHILVYH